MYCHQCYCGTFPNCTHELWVRDYGQRVTHSSSLRCSQRRSRQSRIALDAASLFMSDGSMFKSKRESFTICMSAALLPNLIDNQFHVQQCRLSVGSPQHSVLKCRFWALYCFCDCCVDVPFAGDCDVVLGGVGSPSRTWCHPPGRKGGQHHSGLVLWPS